MGRGGNTALVAMDLGERVWDIVDKWNYFAKDTVGKQLVRAADSVAANISEGYGRFFYKENKQLCYYSRGSLYETKTWLTKAHSRKFVTDEDFTKFQKDIKLNNYINSIGTQKSFKQKEDAKMIMTNDVILTQ